MSSKGGEGPPAPPTDYSDYVQCPYCARRFNEAAAQKHIPACKDMIHNKSNNQMKAAALSMAFIKK